MHVPPFKQVIPEHGSELVFVHALKITVLNKIAVIAAVSKITFVCFISFWFGVRKKIA